MSAAISGITGAQASSAASASGSFGELSTDEFVKILVTELSNQDPFEPNDSAQVLEQLSSLRNIESQMSLQEQLESLVSQNQIAQASGMIGKVVQGLDLNNNRLVGVVTSVRVSDGQAILELDTGQTLSMDRVEQITNLEMETSGIYGMAKLLGHNAVSMNLVLANRASGEFAENAKEMMDKLIKYCLEKIVA